MIDLLRRRMMIQVEPKDIIINREWSDNDAALMDVIYAQGWSKSKKYMTKREAEAVTNIGGAFNGNTAIASFKQLEYFTGLTYITQNAFAGCTSLEEVTIPYNVKNIGGNNDWAATSFSNCTSLRKVTFANGGSVTHFYGRVFEGSLIESITLPDTTTWMSHVLRNCKKLTSITIPPLVTRLINASFMSCSSLKEIAFTSNLKTIDTNAFYGTGKKNIYFTGSIDDWCANIYGDLRSYGFTLYINGQQPTSVEVNQNILSSHAFTGQLSIENVTISDNVTELNAYTFLGCKNLKTLSIGSGLTILHDGQFKGCSSLEDLTIPNNITEIRGEYLLGVFQDCTSIKSITISDSVTLIGKSCFQNCSKALFVKVGNGCKTIEHDAFRNLSSAQYIDIGTSIENIGNHAFLTTKCPIIIRAINPPIIESETIKDTSTFYVPDESVDAYKNADIWSGHQNLIKSINDLPIELQNETT